jgi:hypothetical protein
VTASIFEDWFLHHFVPEVKEYCPDNNLHFKALLILNNALGHPPILQHHHPNTEIVFLPPNTTALLQPMAQGVIASLKAYYLRRTFERLIEAVYKEDGPTIKEFWKSFNVLDAVKIIKEAWNAVTESSLKGVWKTLYPEFVQDFEGFENHVANVTETVIEIANRLDSEVSPEDVTELLQSHTQDLRNEDLIEYKEQGIIEEDEDEQEAAMETGSPPAFTTQKLAEAFRHIK